MIKMFHYVKEKWYLILLIVCLLVLQAYCDLSLPSYTSDIINVGLQQKGIEDGVPDEIREASMQQLLLFMQSDDAKLVLSHYKLTDGIYKLQSVDETQRAELNTAFGIPMLAMTYISKGSETGDTQAGGMTEFDPSMLAQMDDEQKAAFLGQYTEKLKEMPDSIVSQAGAAYVVSEYQEMGRDVDKMQTDYLLKVGIRMVLMAMLCMLCAVSVTFLSCRLAATLGRNLRDHVYHQVISFSGVELNKFSTASLITRSTNDIQQVQNLFMMIFRIVLYAPILGVGGVLKVVQTDASMSWILGVAVAAIMVIVFLLFAIAMPKFKVLQDLIDKLNLVTREILTGIPVIRAFSTEKHEEDRFEKANIDLTKTNLFVNRAMTFMFPLMMLLMNGITVLIMWNGSHAVDSGSMQVGNMMAFIQYAMQIIMSFLMICVMSIMIPRASVAAKRINEVLDTSVSIRDPEDASKENQTREKGSVIFDNVSFTYPGADENVLSNISFEAHRGETVAFIGSTGSGKSTLVQLIPRIFDVTQGEVRVDGVDVRDYKLHDLRTKIGYVPQKGVLFSGTIDSNLRFGAQDASEEQIRKAARIAQAEEFISEKTEGMDAPIAQGGSNVSGGQKQRLAIARAIAKQPEIYVFDDSFSALDFKTDAALRHALKQETEDATVLIVAQRVSTIMHADRILVLEDGSVAGCGTHKELLKSCDVYRQIAMSQLSEEELAQ